MRGEAPSGTWKIPLRLKPRKEETHFIAAQKALPHPKLAQI